MADSMSQQCGMVAKKANIILYSINSAVFCPRQTTSVVFCTPCLTYSS